MKKKLVAPFLSGALAVLASQAHAQSTVISPYGMPISCIAANNFPVTFFLTDQAMQSGGGYATYENNWPVVYLSPSLLRSLPPRAGTFLVYHECAHLSLPMGVGLGSPDQETSADCYAAQHMVSTGLIQNWGEFREAMVQLRSLVGTYTHPPGPIRVENAANCSGLWATSTPAIAPEAGENDDSTDHASIAFDERSEEEQPAQNNDRDICDVANRLLAEDDDLAYEMYISIKLLDESFGSMQGLECNSHGSDHLECSATGGNQDIHREFVESVGSDFRSCFPNFNENFGDDDDMVYVEFEDPENYNLISIWAEHSTSTRAVLFSW